VTTADFALRALYRALDQRRRERQLTWSALAAEVNRHRTTLRPIAVSTIKGLETKLNAEGDGILQMLLWLGRSPESFVPSIAHPDAERNRLPDLKRGQILRWDTPALYRALDLRRREDGLTWPDIARAVGSTPAMLANLQKGPRTNFPQVMRLVSWLDQPAVTFTRIAAW
jgi:hypothetical protein